MILKQVIQYENDKNTLEATWVDDEGAQIKCHAYNGSTLDDLKADLGADLPQYEELIADAVSHWVEPPPVPAPPIVVSPRQIRQALTRANLRTQVEAAVVAGDQDIKDWWEFAIQIEEDHPMVLAMAAGLGVDETALHNLFVMAQSL